MQVPYIKSNYHIVALQCREILERKICQGEYFDLNGRKWKRTLVKVVEWKQSLYRPGVAQRVPGS